MRSCNSSCGGGGPFFWIIIGGAILLANTNFSSSVEIPILFFALVGVCFILLSRKRKHSRNDNTRRNIPIEGADTDKKEDFKEEDFV